MVMTKKQVVEGIMRLLDEEKKWCKQMPATDRNGLWTFPVDPNAVSWCIYGAARKVLNLGPGKLDKSGATSEGTLFWQVMKDVGGYDPQHPGTGSIGFYNDTHTYAEIMDRLREVFTKYHAEEGEAIQREMINSMTLAWLEDQGVRA